MNPETAKRCLTSVSEDKKFWCNNGEVFSNLSELLEGIKKMGYETFDYHVNEEKNDFASWVYDVVGDADLASKLRNKKNKKETTKVIKARIESLRTLTK